VKLRLVGNENTITRKIREAILSVEVTRTYSKEQILELYFNQIYYGNQAYGIKAAAQSYFAKADLNTLTLPEAALWPGCRSCRRSSIRRRPRTPSVRRTGAHTSSTRCRASG